jgi:hypothetical protein
VWKRESIQTSPHDNNPHLSREPSPRTPHHESTQDVCGHAQRAFLYYFHSRRCHSPACLDPLDQLFADIEAEEGKKKMEARLEEIHRNRVIPLHRRIRKRNESTIFAVDELVCSKATTTTKQSQPTIPRDTTPVDAHGTDLREYLFEVKYMACWEISTRGFDNPLREDLMQINLLCARLDEPSEEDLIKLLEVLRKIYLKYMEHDTDKMIHDEQCFDRLWRL